MAPENLGLPRAVPLDVAFQTANALQNKGDLRGAEQIFRAILAKDRHHAGALNNLALLRLAQGKLDEAIQLIRQALKRNPNSPEAQYNLANALAASGRADDAVKRYKKAISLRPGYVDARNNLGLLLNRLGRHDEAIAQFERALAAAPDHVQAHNNLGLALQAVRRYEEAVGHFERAVALAPNAAEAYSNLGNAIVALNRHEEALARYDAARALRPDFPEAEWNEGATRMSLGDFAVGWRKLEARWLKRDAPQRRDFRPPLWLGESALVGKTILLHAEQGLGDTIQFVRYVPLVAALGARVVLEVQKPLVPLLQDLPGVAALCCRGDALPPFDCHCPIMSLPLAFDTRLETIPAAIPYLSAAADRVARWRAELGDGDRPRLGLVWAGNLSNANDRNRSSPLEPWLPVLERTGWRALAIQKDVSNGDRKLLEHAATPSIGGRLEDFADTAAVIALLDVVIAVDTAVAHLAGALGKPVWVVLPYSAEWRWLIGRSDSPWYPTARLFRQRAPGDWPSVVAEVLAALAEEPPPTAP